MWLIGRDESTPKYTVLYYDSRSVSRVYEMNSSEPYVEDVEGSAGLLAAL